MHLNYARNERARFGEAAVNKMFRNDKFSQWLGIEIWEIKPGSCDLKMFVRDEMLNGFDILHGGVTFSMADSALAFASNSHGRLSVVIEANMSFPKSAKTGDVLNRHCNRIKFE